MKRLAVITTHPIQYNAPLFRLLSERKNIELQVFYTWSQSKDGLKYDPGFGRTVEWDIPLLEGYSYRFSENISASPGSHHFKGIENPGLIKEIEDWKPDAILVYGWSFKSHFKAMRYFHKKMPVFFRGDSTLLGERAGIKRIIRRLFLKFVYSFADTALYAGKVNRDYFEKHGFKSADMIFMPHAVENNRFNNSEPIQMAAAELTKSLGIPASAIVFLFAGKLDENKNADLLATAFLKVADKQSFLVFAGSGPQEEKLHYKFGQYPQIRFIGFQNQEKMPAVYALCDIYVMPSKSETWGLGINEAMAAGKAVIASSGCGGAYDLVTTDTGFIFNKDSAEELEECIKYFIEHKDASREMGKNSEILIQQYSFDRDCKAIEEAIK